MTKSELAVFIAKVCLDLEIALPNILYQMPNNASKTALSLCVPSDNTIYIKSVDTINPDLVFSVVHELRHLWQFQYNREKFLSDYKLSTELSIEDYNLQEAEIDANAYGKYVMNNCFGINPLFNGLSEKVKLSINKRMTEIEDDDEQ